MIAIIFAPDFVAIRRLLMADRWKSEKKCLFELRRFTPQRRARLILSPWNALLCLLRRFYHVCAFFRWPHSFFLPNLGFSRGSVIFLSDRSGPDTVTEISKGDCDNNCWVPLLLFAVILERSCTWWRRCAAVSCSEVNIFTPWTTHGQ